MPVTVPLCSSSQNPAGGMLPAGRAPELVVATRSRGMLAPALPCQDLSITYPLPLTLSRQWLPLPVLILLSPFSPYPGGSPLPAERVLDLLVAIQTRLVGACCAPAQPAAGKACAKQQRTRRNKKVPAAAAANTDAAAPAAALPHEVLRLARSRRRFCAIASLQQQGRRH